MKRLLRYMKPYRLYAILSPLLMIGEVLADLILPFLTTYLVNFGIEGFSVYDPEYGNGIAAALIRFFGVADGNRVGIIWLFGILMLCVTLVGGFFGTFCAYTAARASQGFGDDLRRDVFSRVMSLSIEQTDMFTTGSLVTRMTNDISSIVDFAEQIMRMFVRAPMFVVGGVVALILLDVRFSFVLACGIPILLVVLTVVLVRLVPLFSVIQKKLDRVNSVVQENVGGSRVVKAYVKEEYECGRFEKANRDLRDRNLKAMNLLAVIEPVLVVIMNFSIVAVIWIGGYRIRIGEAGMNVGTVMAAITYITQVIFSVMMVTMVFQSVSRAMASIRRVNEVLDTVPIIQSGERTEGNPNAEYAVEFDRVDFRYPGTVGAPVLSGIDLKVKKGEFLAVIGETGSGKSSLVSMIPRFYDPEAGEVRVDGVPVKEYELSSLRRKIGYVMQKSELFSDTVENNIRWGRPEADEAQVTSAAVTAQADEFVTGFNDGYKTFIAEKGASLSGGQKQRISIARAVARKPEIMILDDSTSALDLATEAKLRAALRAELKDTTVIMIAQRIASVKEADRIAVIERDGTILHCAPHDVLMRESETYRDICASQNKNGGEIA